MPANYRKCWHGLNVKFTKKVIWVLSTWNFLSFYETRTVVAGPFFCLGVKIQVIGNQTTNVLAGFHKLYFLPLYGSVLRGSELAPIFSEPVLCFCHILLQICPALQGKTHLLQGHAHCHYSMKETDNSFRMFKMCLFCVGYSNHPCKEYKGVVKGHTTEVSSQRRPH